MVSDSNMPHIPWPGEDGIHKVVQFYVDNEPYMEFSQNPNERHSFIVGRFARRIKVSPRVISIQDIPVYFLPDEDRYKMPGMGRCELKRTEEGRIAEFFGFSEHYKIKRGSDEIPIEIDEEHLELSKPFARGINMWYNQNRVQ